MLGIHGLPSGAVVLNAHGKIARMPAVPVWWSKKLRPRHSFYAWVVLNGLPHPAAPKVRVFVAPAK